jgi:hypothetical protein
MDCLKRQESVRACLACEVRVNPWGAGELPVRQSVGPWAAWVGNGLRGGPARPTGGRLLPVPPHNHCPAAGAQPRGIAAVLT